MAAPGSMGRDTDDTGDPGPALLGHRRDGVVLTDSVGTPRASTTTSGPGASRVGRRIASASGRSAIHRDGPTGEPRGGERAGPRAQVDGTQLLRRTRQSMAATRPATTYIEQVRADPGEQ